MRLNATAHIDFSAESEPLLLMFHGYGNDETEMIRVIDAVYRDGAEPSYLSFAAPHLRPYLGGRYWYPDGCGVEERRRACRAAGAAVVAMIDAPVFSRRSKVLIGFSQGGYLAYRMVVDHPDLFDAAVLLSPSFKGERGTVLDCRTRFMLAYGGTDVTIPPADQLTARHVLAQSGRLVYREYKDMGHAICDREIADIHDFLHPAGAGVASAVEPTTLFAASHQRMIGARRGRR
ncbi:alpha/beta hydrolase [Bifidobacterium jacchi]|uniref:Phospholipase n=1 Tax=Bifidobacterium jacchi TaxID=2490545 RepID=A0A5N5RKE1_9BIFI|nr:phospholipase [Bifidobacterium jacchi]KAB5607766.1 phospholipase [Bifidobacterium jacchi]